MAARRLLIVMLVLLVISTLAAALVPPPPERQETTESAPSRQTTPIRAGGGELVKARIDAGAKKPERIRLALGDQLALIVSSRQAAQIEIRGLGLLEDALPLSPARFDILATREGSFPIRRLEPGKELGVIRVPKGR